MAETVRIVDAPVDAGSESQIDVPFEAEIRLSKDMEAQFKNFLDQEIREALNDRTEFDDNLARWQEVYNAPPATEVKDFPLANSANLTVPVIKEAVNTLTAQLSQTVITPTPKWVIKTDSDEWKMFTGILERFLDRAAREDLNVDDAFETWILEGGKYGTAIVEVTHAYDKRQWMVYGRDGKTAYMEERVFKEGPELVNVPLQNFILPFTSNSIQDARWVAKRFRKTSVELHVMEANGFFGNLSKVLIEDADNQPQGDALEEVVEEKHRDLQDADPGHEDSFEFFEWWGRYDIGDGKGGKGKGQESELLVYYHMKSRSIARIQYHPYWHGERPFVEFIYFPVEYRFYGQGICEQLEELQEEISTIHNQRLDGSSTANVKPVLSRRLASSLKSGDALFTGQVIEVDDPTSDVMPLKLSDTPPSTVLNEQITRGYVERLVGLNEASSRGVQPTSRTTATAQSLLLQESKQRFDQTIRKLRRGIGQVGKLIFMDYFQYGVDKKKPIQWLGKRGKIINGILSLDRKALDLGLGFESAAPTSQLNKETQRSQSIQMFNLTIQMYGQLLDFIREFIPPEQMALIAGSMVKTAKGFMFQVYERFDVTDPDEVLSTLTLLESILPKSEEFSGAEAVEDSVRETKALEGIQRLEALLGGNPGEDGASLEVLT